MFCVYVYVYNREKDKHAAEMLRIMTHLKTLENENKALVNDMSCVIV